MDTKLGQWAKVFCIVGIISAFFLSASCELKREPIKLGLVGTFTGPFSDLGIGARNGAILAVEEWNQRGGIKGRPIKLIIKDDKNDPAEAVKADQALIEEGVVAIIGHMTSEMSLAAYTLVNEKKTLMVSPTSSSPIFSGKDDYFIRVVSASVETPKRLAEHALENNLKKISAVYSLANKAYCEPYIEAFRHVLESAGGFIVTLKGISEADRGSYDLIAMEILAKGPDAILLVLSAIEAASMSQQIRKFNLYTPLLSSGWALSQDLIAHGGRAVEGMVFVEFFYPSLKSKGMNEFTRRYEERFGIKPNFSATYGYDACNVVIGALCTNPDKQALKYTILKTKRFDSPLGSFEIDEFGDAVRPYYLIRVLKGIFVSSDEPEE